MLQSLTTISTITRRFYGARRIRLSSKNGNQQYYKGSRSGAMGTIDPYGKFRADPEKVREWMIPDLEQCDLRPYVSKLVMPFGDNVKVPRDVKSFMEMALANDANKVK